VIRIRKARVTVTHTETERTLDRKPRNVSIIGAGIAGLTTAIALSNRGHQVRIFERHSSVEPLGAGLILWSNAIRAMRDIGLEESVLQIGQPLSRLSITAPDGRILGQTNAAQISEDAGAATIAVHRADLIALLLKHLPRESLQTGRPFVAASREGSNVIAHFEDGSSESADILIGADGLNSRVREWLRGPEAPRYSGYTAWRGISTRPAGFSDNSESSTETWGRGRRFGWVPLTENRVYWFAVKNAPEGQAIAADHDRGELMQLFGTWHSPIPETIAATSDSGILRHDIYDRNPLSSWGNGPVTLIGDAAHPMTPNTGQGAAQAIEDAVVLASCLSKYQTLDAALRSYEAIRIPRTSMIARLSRRIGAVAQVENPILCHIRDLASRCTPESLTRRQFEELVNWSPPER
jgi:2-polyprenyl-6-methoxyphenol hydroxylase-like FAD-dependent oxidoreductase